MSWSISRIGKASAVLAVIRGDIAAVAGSCPEPELSALDAVGEALTVTLGAYPPDAAVKVNAYGSQWPGVGGSVGALLLQIEPVPGFTE